MIKQPSFKIALVGEMLSRGGAERVQARLSIFFEEQGVEVHHIIVRDEITYKYAGTMYNMGKLKDESNTFFNRFSRFLALKKYLNEHQFDFIIDFRVKNRFVQEFIIANWIYRSPFIMSIRSFNTNFYFPKNRFFAKIIYKKAYGLITVSKALEERVKTEYGYKRVKTIYNPIDSITIKELAAETSPLNFNYVLGIGRMKGTIKQFDHLILAFKNSVAIEKGLKLVLMGDGDNKKELMSFAQEEGVGDSVVFIPYQENPFPYLRAAYFTALTSRNEGFPNVLIESLACETPVVAYDCESGPSEIIIDRYNGLLVKNQDIDAMSKAIGELIDDLSLYQLCKSNTLESIEKFGTETIGKEWLDYLKNTN